MYFLNDLVTEGEAIKGISIETNVAPGKLNPIPLVTEIFSSMEKSRNQFFVKITGICNLDEEYEEEPKLVIQCNSSRYGQAYEGVIKDNLVHYDISIPAIFVHREIECQVKITDVNSDVLRESNITYIELDDDFGEKFPKIIWRKFSEDFPEIEDLFWYIQADPDLTVRIYFNDDVKFFKAAIVSSFSEEFYDIFYIHFRQIYATALLMRVKSLNIEDLALLDNIDTPYHQKMFHLIEPILDKTSNPWMIFAYLQQKPTGIIGKFNKILSEGVIYVKND